MTAYDDSVKDQVQSANDIVELIGQYVSLKRAGRNFKGLCPFHQEKTPSFMVQPEKQIFRCFGCGVGGDVFTFVMRYENLNFPEALRQLAERAHISLPSVSASRREKKDEVEQLNEIYRSAAEYYHAEFLHPVRGKPARDYFFKRSFDETMAKEFKMGWASDHWQALFEHLSKKGYPDTLLLKSGLIHRSAKGNLYDVFRGRLLFPIQNLQGRIVAFGGRVLTEKSEGPKYLNSPENPIFHKRRELFGLHVAKRYVDRERPQILVMEGYFDFLRAYQQGFQWVVATLGTSLTEDHVRLLKRFAEEAVVVYDGDKAGQAAALRGLEVFLEEGMSVKLVRMPQGYDPDDYLLKKGKEDFKKLLDQASDFFDFKLSLLLERYNRWDSLGLMRITSDFLETLVKVKHPVLLDRYLRRLAGALGIDENSLRQELKKLQKKTAETVKTSPDITAKVSKDPHPEEIILLGILIDEPRLREQVWGQIEPSDFIDSEARDLFDLVRNMEQRYPHWTWPQVLSRIENESLKERLLSRGAFETSFEEKEKAVMDCTAMIKRKQKDRKLDELRHRIAQAEKEGDVSKVGAYVQEYQTLLRQSV